MVVGIFRWWQMDDDDMAAYKEWIKTPLAEKIDAVVDASYYKYDFVLVYNYEEKHYRRVIDSVDIRFNEIPLFKSTPNEPPETESEVLTLINDAIEQIKIAIDDEDASDLIDARLERAKMGR